MPIDYSSVTRTALPVQIADAIEKSIRAGALAIDQRLPSESELAQRFAVSRPTVREALKRLAARNLIRTERGAAGGAFVNRPSWTEAHSALVTTAQLLIGLGEITFADAIETRRTLALACLPLAAARRTAEHLDRMAAEVSRQGAPGLSDEDFCASDVAFHRVLADATGNPMLAFQMAGVVEGMQPLMNMLTYRARDRRAAARRHGRIHAALGKRDAAAAAAAMAELLDDFAELASQRPSSGSAVGRKAGSPR